MEIRLAEDGDLVARILQNARDDRSAEGRVVDIGVARDEQEIAVIPAAIDHILFGNREKTVHKSPFALQSVKNIYYEVQQSGKTKAVPTLLQGRWFYGDFLQIILLLVLLEILKTIKK